MDLSDVIKAETLAAATPTPADSPSPVRGTGGGLADAVPATVDGVMPAAISEGEYVVPADVVSMLGDGSSEAGARVLEGLISKIRQAKQGGDDTQQASITEVM